MPIAMRGGGENTILEGKGGSATGTRKKVRLGKGGKGLQLLGEMIRVKGRKKSLHQESEGTALLLEQSKKKVT